MRRKKSTKPRPLPPRDGLGASRARLPGDRAVTAFDFIARVITEQRYRHPDDDAHAVMQRFDAGEVVLRDGTPLRPDDLIEPGTDVFFYRHPAPERPVPFDIETVFEDDYILVVNKPHFLATMPRAAHITESATVRLRRATGNEELTPAHRLDRMTAGLLLLTKRAEHRGAYQELFARREVRKRYVAIARDAPVPTPTVWTHHIDKQPGELVATLQEGLPANAETHVLARAPIDAPSLQAVHGVVEPLACYVLEPVTGRTHQLRVQMCAAGVPIVGDPLYPTAVSGGVEDFRVPMRLAAVVLEFTDPLTGRGRCFGLDACGLWG
ncbi:pseudouridine synthase [Corynebacterium liangguodongii]|uniref:RNA pseudouridylate synthase n=1 Tax=Corynebacterium liangguodongii TaxID=2079535 RepID=A0A2S0WGN3_9CORY|nr:pseudouridine synthase [Corynebacterium liangguodongii]AWB84886.1 23S rRNA pseudouridylate synthase [Corynebacterium liangguodongii]PWB99242.1 23S rRNA pseudouridylate synthase [Corynebacterium liangguodongii]